MVMCLWSSYKKNMEKNKNFCIHKVTEERIRIQSWIQIQIHLSVVLTADPDLHQKVTDPQHCSKFFCCYFR